MIEVRALTKLYGQFVAVNELSFSVKPGEVVGLVGPNGAGKTTTLRCLAGIIPPTRGSISINGYELARNPIPAKRRLALFTDEPRLFDYLTVQQHLAFVARIYGVENYEADRQAFARGVGARGQGQCLARRTLPRDEAETGDRLRAAALARGDLF